MKKKSVRNILLILVPVAFFSSCVSSKQFNDLKDSFGKLQEERGILKAENEALSVKNNELQFSMDMLGKKIEQLQQDSIRLSEDLATLQEKYSTLNKNYRDLKKAQDELVQGNVKETRRLLRELQRTQEDLQTKEDSLRKLEKSLISQRANLEKLQLALNERNQRLLELERIVNTQDSILTALKKRVSDALLGFEGEGLSVTRKNGKVYVSLQEKLLFQTGSYSVDPRGKEALKKLARVLEKNPDINITIEGHTDNVPYISNGGPIQDNWDLSVKRATSIVRILLDGTTINPRRLTAAGRGEFFPVDPADTPEARRKNRRTEIILTPNLDELFDIIDKQ
ncbi:MAG: OmpA family protein [Chlorobi bacterium]|nr:OmpA family protein [Chlorobiota bacterium]